MRSIWNKLPIRHKILAIIVLTILLVAITIFPAVSRLTRDALELQQREHLHSVKNLVTRLFEDYQHKVTNYTKLFSNDREIKNSLFYYAELAGEREHPLLAVSRLFKSFDVNTIEIGDSRGRTVAAAEDPEKHDIDRSGDPLIRNALKGDAAAGIVLGEKGFVIKASAPIFYNENQIIGTITAGILLDDALLLKIRELSNTDLMIADTAGRVVSSTLRQSAGHRASVARVKAGPAGGGNDLVLTFALSDVSGIAVGTVTIVQEDKVPGIIARTHVILSVLLIVILVVSAVLLFITFKKLMRPVLRLKEGAERIGKGEFSHRILVESGDEIGELSDGFNAMARNLEGLRSMEERLSRSEQMAAVGTFAAGIAHEINNPIGNVIGIAKLLQKNTLVAEMREDIDTIVKNAERCARITRDLLAYSRQSPPKGELVPLAALIADAARDGAPLADRKGVVLRQEVADGLPDLFVDPFQMNQALGNILLNAVQATGSGGTVTLRASTTAESLVEIAVADTGCGIAEEVRGKIFYPFFTTKPVGEGTGLGLAITYGIIKNHGGDITVKSETGCGSTFTIRMPRGETRG